MPQEDEPSQPQTLDLTALNLDQILSLFIGILIAKAWQYMGIQLAPNKKEPEKDMAKAAVTIDSVSLLAGKLAPMLPEDEARRLNALITDLKLNYAKNAQFHA